MADLRVIEGGKPEEEDLPSLMDKATRRMLEDIADRDTDLAPNDRVKMYGAATDWLVARLKVAPPQKAESKFATLKRRLDRKSGSRGNSGDEAEEG